MAVRKNTYRLYAMVWSREAEELAYQHRFHRIGGGYILLYLSGRKKPEGAVEVAGADLDRLTDGDRQWLAECGMELLAEAAVREGVTSREMEKRWKSTLDRLEQELQAERERMKGGGAHGSAN